LGEGEPVSAVAGHIDDMLPPPQVGRYWFGYPRVVLDN
jgi:hypothetical protein